MSGELKICLTCGDYAWHQRRDDGRWACTRCEPSYQDVRGALPHTPGDPSPEEFVDRNPEPPDTSKPELTVERMHQSTIIYNFENLSIEWVEIYQSGNVHFYVDPHGASKFTSHEFDTIISERKRLMDNSNLEEIEDEDNALLGKN